MSQPRMPVYVFNEAQRPLRVECVPQDASNLLAAPLGTKTSSNTKIEPSRSARNKPNSEEAAETAKMLKADLSDILETQMQMQARTVAKKAAKRLSNLVSKPRFSLLNLKQSKNHQDMTDDLAEMLKKTDFKTAGNADGGRNKAALKASRRIDAKVRTARKGGVGRVSKSKEAKRQRLPLEAKQWRDPLGKKMKLSKAGDESLWKKMKACNID